jgi:hypothetical protein
LERTLKSWPSLLFFHSPFSPQQCMRDRLFYVISWRARLVHRFRMRCTRAFCLVMFLCA